METQTNGLNAHLVKLTGESEFARGVLQERQNAGCRRSAAAEAIVRRLAGNPLIVNALVLLASLSTLLVLL